MGRYTRLLQVSATAAMCLLAGCAGMKVAPTPVSAGSPPGVPGPTATQIAVGANPHPSGPRVNQFVAQVSPPGRGGGANPYSWLEDVHSARARRWVSKENRGAERALAALPQRSWIGRRLAQLQSNGQAHATNDVVVERVVYIGPDGAPLPMEVVHRRDMARDGNHPTLLTVCRATQQPPGRLLQPFVLVWVEMGGVYARAQVRHRLASAPPARAAGTLPDRSIALGDLFAAGQALIDHGYTRRARLGIYGRDFAGLMAGTAALLRPDFFGAALPTGTWPQYLRVASGNCFPPTLITAGGRDGDIRPWQGDELAAAMQAEQVCGRHPILIRDEREEEPAAQREREADELAFAAKWLGAAEPARGP